MMNKAQLKRELSQSVNGAGMMTMEEVQRFLGRSREYTRQFLKEVDSIGQHKGRMFYVGDIAEKIMEMRCKA